MGNAVDLARSSAVEEEDGDKKQRKVVKSDSGSSKIGLLMMELFTGKVIVMMMLVLVVSALLDNNAKATQKDLGLHTLVALYEAVRTNSPPLSLSSSALRCRSRSSRPVVRRASESGVTPDSLALRE